MVLERESRKVCQNLDVSVKGLKGVGELVPVGVGYEEDGHCGVGPRGRNLGPFDGFGGFGMGGEGDAFAGPFVGVARACSPKYTIPSMRAAEGCECSWA